MSSELNLWQSRAVERQQGRQLDHLSRERNVGIATAAKDRDIAVAKVLGTADVVKTVMHETFDIGLARRQYETMVPELSGYMEMLQTRGVIAMAEQIERPGRGW
jgi:hypothetical protein